MSRHARSVIVAPLLTAVLVACGAFANVGEDPDACDLKPIGTPAAGLRLGVQKAAALCPSLVEIEGRTYSQGGRGYWDEDALVLEEYGTISRANDHVFDPTVYSLAGVDPRRLLITRNDRSVRRGEDTGMGNYWTLWGEGGAGFPEEACRYLDPAAQGYPRHYCPLTTGRTYAVWVSLSCGLDVRQGPYGGEYWTVVDPPPPPAAGSTYPGMGGPDIDYGELELLDADHAIYRSERGAELELRRLSRPPPPKPSCEPDVSTAP